VEKINQRYELYGLSQEEPSFVPSLSACFLLVRTELMQTLGGFDEQYFMYMEDVDLVRRIGDIAETIYYPTVQVTHSYSKGSYKKLKLLYYHTHSAIKYFNKWGWLFDKTRRDRNKIALAQLKTTTKID
jgi:GT2 family glycosyltransferase